MMVCLVLRGSVQCYGDLAECIMFRGTETALWARGQLAGAERGLGVCGIGCGGRTRREPQDDQRHASVTAPLSFDFISAVRPGDALPSYARATRSPGPLTCVALGRRRISELEEALLSSLIAQESRERTWVAERHVTEQTLQRERAVTAQLREALRRASAVPVEVVREVSSATPYVLRHLRY
eukprot:2066465-Rhodomonas_salina.1